MKARLTIIAAALIATAFMAQAQQAAPADNAASAPATPPCVQQKRHDHGADRYAPTPQRGCKQAAKSEKGDKAIKGHNHSTFHKTM